jgi:amino acid adenylation domain-containing protein
MISARSRTAPDGTAVVDGNRRLTYAELERQADRLAAGLGRLGVGPGSCVALFLERSSEFIVSAYGTWKAGAAYLPIDVATPRDRTEFVLSDSGASTVITGTREAEALPAGPWQVVKLDRTGLAPDCPCTAIVDPEPESLAYVIYTSGSTGRPKGVELTHGNLANLVRWHLGAFEVTATDRASQIASVGFDAAVWEIWPHLAAGAALHIADEPTRRSPQHLRDWLVEQGITISFAPTVLAEQLIHLRWPRGTALRTLLTGADVLHRRPDHGLPFVLVNNYGPTECTVVATSGHVEPSANGDSTPSIGRPIANTTALILDDSLRPVAPGESGELCLAGAHVGRGYRHDAELTASRFVTIQFEASPPLRIYRTGDIVRLLDSGEIAFLGRRDRQIKIRGFRIEPAEIVAALDLVPEVDASAVVVRATRGAEPELVAYVVAADHALPTAPQLRAFLAARLPDYMVPSWFIRIGSPPVTLNGKLDEAALPPPRADNLLPGQADLVSGQVDGPLENRIAAIVRALLDVPSVGIRDNIFLVGGHSLLAMQLMSRIKQVFGVKLTLRQLFEHPTVEELTAAVARRTSVNKVGAGSS